MIASFFVAGHPEPAGSKKAFQHKTTKRVIVMDANKKAKPWQYVIQGAATEAMGYTTPAVGPLDVTFTFYVDRPKGHFRQFGHLSAEGLRNPYPAKKPDLLKLARAVEDALTGIVYKDDAQIVSETLHKAWTGNGMQVEGVRIAVSEAL